MSENKSFYIERLLSEIRSLQENVMEVSKSGNLPFTFFKESFIKTQKINELLHNLEFMQIDDLKGQMERLVVVLSGKEQKEQEAALEKEKEKEFDKEIEKEGRTGNIHAQRIELPEYRNPYSQDVNYFNTKESDLPVEKIQEKSEVKETKVVKNIIETSNSSKSINDIIKTVPAVVDIKRGISLNDRFIFQRELFGNDRHKMNSTLEKLSELESYEEAENYIRENVSADIDNPTVADFLLIVRKGFK